MSFPEIPFNETLFDNELMQEYWNRSTENRSNQFGNESMHEEREMPSELQELQRMSEDSVVAQGIAMPFSVPNKKANAKVLAKSFTTPTSGELIVVILVIFLAIIAMSHVNWH